MSSNIIEIAKQNPSPNPHSQSPIKPSSTLILQIKSAIEKHYHSLPKKLLNEKVRTEVIPIIISLFFEGQGRSTKNIGSSVEISLAEKQNKQRNGQIGKGMSKKGDKLYNISNIFTGKQELSAEELINKTVALCKIVSIIHNSRLKRQNQSQIFDLERKRKQKVIIGIKWLARYFSFNQRRHAIKQFYRNLYTSKKSLQACKTLHKVYLLHLSKYFTQLTSHTLVPRLTQPQNLLLAHWQSTKTKCRNKGILILGNFYGRRLRNALGKVKEYNYSNNRWRTEWVRRVVFRTPVNLQTSLWKLVNYWKNTHKIEEQRKPSMQVDEIKQDTIIINSQQPSNKSLKSLKSALKHPIPNQLILTKIDQAQNDDQIQAILFTKQQKAQLLCQQLEYVYGLLRLEALIQGFGELDAYQPEIGSSSILGDKDEKDGDEIEGVIQEDVKEEVGRLIDNFEHKPYE